MRDSSPHGRPRPLRTGRRKSLAGLAALMAWPAFSAAASAATEAATTRPPARATAATPPLPAQQLRVQLRCVPANQADATDGSPPPPPSSRSTTAVRSVGGTAPPAGSVVVNSKGSTPRPGSGDVTTRSGTAAASWPGAEVIVANGEQALLRWQVERDLPPAVFVWAGGGAPAPGHGAAAPAALVGLDLRATAAQATRMLGVLARWPGGTSPVRLNVNAEELPAADASRQAAALAVQTVVSVALDRWTTVARSLASPGTRDALALQLRVSLVPE